MVADALREPIRAGGRPAWPRLRLVAAVLVDAATLAGMLALTVSLAGLWLLLRTEWGLLDVGGRDADVAFAVSHAGYVLFAALEAMSLAAGGRTLGGTVVGLRAASAPAGGARRAAWVGLHPALAPAWFWVAGALALPPAPGASEAVTLLGLAVVGLALVSLAVLLVRPEAAPMHTRLARAGERRG